MDIDTLDDSVIVDDNDTDKVLVGVFGEDGLSVGVIVGVGVGLGNYLYYIREYKKQSIEYILQVHIIHFHLCRHNSWVMYKTRDYSRNHTRNWVIQTRKLFLNLLPFYYHLSL